MEDSPREVRIESSAALTANDVLPVALLVAVAGVAWAVTVDRMRGMDMGPGTDLGAFGWFAGVWVTMMAAMMLPSLEARLLRRRPGALGALTMGVEQGRYCVGCSCALMAALFALGVMSIGWMVLIAALIATQKLLPWETIPRSASAVLLVALGVAVMVFPDQVPGLTIPASATSMP